MSIGKSFEEIIQKGLRMIGQGMHGFVGNRDLDSEISIRNFPILPIYVYSLLPRLSRRATQFDRVHELTR